MMHVAIALAVAADQSLGFAPSRRWARPTAELAAELLTPEQAADVVSHSFGWPIFQDGIPPSVRFLGRPRPTGDGFCHRHRYYVSIKGEGEGEPRPPVVGDDVRRGNCDGPFAHINPGADLNSAKRVLHWLGWAQTAARSESSLPFALSCKSETDQDKCARGADAVLAALPLGKTTTITRGGRVHHWKISITETEPGQLFWDVRINATPGQESIDLGWKIPAPY